MKLITMDWRRLADLAQAGEMLDALAGPGGAFTPFDLAPSQARGVLLTRDGAEAAVILSAAEFKRLREAAHRADSTKSYRLDEGQRQAVLLAIARLAVERPGWDVYLREIAEVLAGGAMFDQFRALRVPTPGPGPGEVAS